MDSSKMNPDPKFGAMIATSTVAMLGLMYLNTYQRREIDEMKALIKELEARR